MVKRLVGIVLLAAATLAGLASARAETRHALVIGINDYREIAPLQKAVGDAEALSRALAGLGYQVTKALNPDRRELNRQVSELINRIKPGDTVLVHYSGHGVELSGQNFLLPADIPTPRANDQDLVKSEAINLADMMERIGSSGAASRIFIIDACRDNPFAKAGARGVGATRGLARVAAPEGSFVLYSAGYGQSALDRLGEADSEPTSVYTRVLLRQLLTPGKPITDIATDIRREVEALAKSVGHEQRPAYYDELTNSRSFAIAGRVNEVVPAGEVAVEPITSAPQAKVPEAAPSQSTPDTNPTGVMASYHEGTDRPGLDYANLEIKEANPKICWSQCNQDGKCQAWAYVKPGIQGQNAVCWFKSGVPAQIANDCCASGAKSDTGQAAGAQSKADIEIAAVEGQEREAGANAVAEEDAGSRGLAAGTSLWNHNGSIMVLEADGDSRRFTYWRPRPAMAKAGWRRGDLVFEGRIAGNRYAGTAYLNSQFCGGISYAVSGPVENGFKRVVMTGEAPIRDKSTCAVTGWRTDRLVFDFVSRQ